MPEWHVNCISRVQIRDRRLNRTGFLIDLFSLPGFFFSSYLILPLSDDLVPFNFHILMARGYLRAPGHVPYLACTSACQSADIYRDRVSNLRPSDIVTVSPD
ncbi:hypothetical protein AVEN_23642-1 [Araneus ventricosus]|uniref:Uncharacterized protein n=1 Tax=Araneus ventricosus TaxID=182803 RepID=A0A4Y2BJQ2_ARAVE|nr:hypothetical protein AVEN_23642-1 [Araneus ventricosus]